mgnify:CR=1 FL=1
MQYKKIKNADLIVGSSKYLVKNPYEYQKRWHELFNNNIFPAMAQKFKIEGDEEEGEVKNEEDNKGKVKLGEEKVKKEKKRCCGGKKNKENKQSKVIKEENTKE